MCAYFSMGRRRRRSLVEIICVAVLKIIYNAYLTPYHGIYKNRVELIAKGIKKIYNAYLTTKYKNKLN